MVYIIPRCKLCNMNRKHNNIPMFDTPWVRLVDGICIDCWENRTQGALVLQYKMNHTVQVKIKPMPGLGDRVPKHMSELSAGIDLYAYHPTKTQWFIGHGDIVVISAGFSMELPPGYEAQIRPRSGLAIKHGITVVNSPGTIDADYRGEIKVALTNISNDDYCLRTFERMAQMVVAQHKRVDIKIVDELGSTDRGSGGFGSSGV